jgi:hypothetical protein
MALVVDGQQRLTTTSTLLAACWHLGRRLARLATTASEAESACCWPGTESLIRECLFRGRSDQTRLVHSLVDREAYQLAVRAGEATRPTDGTRVLTPLLAARTRFDFHLEQHVRGKSVAEALVAVKQIVESCLDLMRPMLVELDPAVNLAAIFQQYQEQSLLGMASFLRGIPGVSFRAADLVRNFVMAEHVELAVEEQEEVYRHVWLEGVEGLAPPGGLDAELDRFLVSVGFSAWELNDDTCDRFVSEFESSVQRVLKIKFSMAQDAVEPDEENEVVVSEKARGDIGLIRDKLSGIALYARFCSYIQQFEQKTFSHQKLADVSSKSVDNFLKDFKKFLKQSK